MLIDLLNNGMDMLNSFGVDLIQFFKLSNANISGKCMGLEPIIRILKNVVKLIQFGVPVLLILFGMIDLGKAVMSSKEDEMKKAQGTLLKRFIYAVAVFLVITLVTFVMGLVGEAGADEADEDSWISCWNSVKI